MVWPLTRDEYDTLCRHDINKYNKATLQVDRQNSLSIGCGPTRMRSVVNVLSNRVRRK